MVRTFRWRALFLGGYVVACSVWACSSASSGNFNNEPDGGTSSGSGSGSGGSGSGGSGSGGGPGFEGGLGTNTDSGEQGETSVTVTTTIYANTDDSLYQVDPKSNAVTLIGAFAGEGDSSTDSTITDVAVNANDEVYACTESAIYKATLPATLPGTVSLQKVATISSASSSVRFYALAFAPAGALGPNENLVGGDGDGNLWSIDPSTGAAVNLGNFGPDPTNSANYMSLSGDIVFYQGTLPDGGTGFLGLATIRSCLPNANPSYSPTCNKQNDYLAGVDMNALATAFSTSTPAATLNAGIYGGSATTLGNGIGHGEVFGLGAAGGTVLGFSRYQSGDGGGQPPALWSIDGTTTGGGGTLIPGSFSFTNGWSGAGVTTKVTIVVGPPPTPPPPK